ncbi:carboxypeptidase regulatory-like domain-containing protein [Fulvivirgaceae bacterium BMA10]|uniref:Carboxypeptidase regulatory-like domain-containing protein n=1 Tax=Splendidivirga corallicola TaxID=3051826 RepID=A0ABT8KIU9_9BACT|nr:carboxypeptidase regulatory-like domain-containing protein [Fulvivirgaceae bacterium BMA10]
MKLLLDQYQNTRFNRASVYLKNLLVITICIILVFISTGSVHGQKIRNFRSTVTQNSLEENKRIADELFSKGLYYSSLNYYQHVLDGDPANYESMYQMAEAYYELRHYDKAAELYQQVMDGNLEDFPLSTYKYAQALQALAQYDQAINMYNNFIGANHQDYASEIKSAGKHIESCRLAQKLLRNSPDVEISKLYGLPGNSSSNFAAIPLNDSIIYFTGSETLHRKKNQRFENFSGKFDTVYFNRIFQVIDKSGAVSRREMVKIPLSSQYQSIGSPSYSSDLKKLYYTICTTNETTSACDLYYSERKSNSWSKPQKLNEVINPPGSNTKHPMIVLDETNAEVLFFSSDRKGGFGGYDIWYCKKDSLGKFNAPVNLGKAINTSSDEITPFFDIHAGNLYFSSNGHVGLGEFDIYMVNLNFEDRNGKVFNLGYPINSSSDDYYFNLYEYGQKGFLTSNRLEARNSESGNYFDNIFTLRFSKSFAFQGLPDYIAEVGTVDEEDAEFNLFDEKFAYKTLTPEDVLANLSPEEDIQISGNLMNADGTPVSGEDITLLNESGETIATTKSDSQGSFAFRNLPGGQFYSVALDAIDEGTSISLDFKDKDGNLLTSANAENDPRFFKFKNLPDKQFTDALLAEEDVTISGSLIQSGMAVANKQVFLTDEAGNIIASTTSDENGRFAFRGLPGGSKYLVAMDEKDQAIEINLELSNEAGQPLAKTSSKSEPALFKYRNLDDKQYKNALLAEEDVTISGTLSLDGIVAANKEVFLTDSKGNIVATTTSDENGNFRFKQLPGGENYSILLNEQDQGLEINLNLTNKTGKVLASANSKRNPALFQYKKLSDQSYESVLLAEEDVSISGTLMNGTLAAANKKVLVVDGDGNVVASAISDDKGSFDFRKLPGGEHYTVLLDESDANLGITLNLTNQNGQVIASANSKQDPRFFQYRSLNDQEYETSLLAEEDISISGTLLQDGTSAVNKKVYLTDSEGNIVAETTTDEKGGFNFKDLPGGKNYQVVMEKDESNLELFVDLKNKNGDLLASVNSNENKNFFAYKDLNNQDTQLNDQNVSDASFNLSEERTSALLSSIRSVMTHKQYLSRVESKYSMEERRILNLRVQIGAYSKPKPGLFDGLINVPTIDERFEGGLVKYLTGNFKNLSEAEILRKRTYDQGILDAFISVYLDGKRIAILIY